MGRRHTLTRRGRLSMNLRTIQDTCQRVWVREECQALLPHANRSDGWIPVIWPASSAPADEACPWLQLMTGASSREKRAAGVSSTPGRNHFHTKVGRSTTPSVSPASERRGTGSCADLCSRTMVAAQLRRLKQLALDVLQQLRAVGRVHLRPFRPQRRGHAGPSKRPVWPSWLEPDEPRMK